MRLVRQVARLEAAAARALEVEEAPVGLMWTSQESRVDGESLAEGEWVAVDLYLGDELDGVQYVRLVERATWQDTDLGWVYDGEGARVGRVVELDGSLLTWRVE